MTFEEKIRRNSDEDRIEIGTIVEGALSGNFGTLLRLIINGLNDEQLLESRTRSTMPSDRYLGRLEALSMLQDRLEQCVDIKIQLVGERLESQKVVEKGEPI